VPLTNSLYVRGKLSNPDRVLVDVGTGFYVEKVSQKAMHERLSTKQYDVLGRQESS
jgi:prefoldin subunit 5